MPPPPKPPIICYDLQTDANARRAPCSRYRVGAAHGATRKSKVTVIKQDQSELLLNHQLKIDERWNYDNYENEYDDGDDGQEESDEGYEVASTQHQRSVPRKSRVSFRRLDDEFTREHPRHRPDRETVHYNKPASHKSRASSFGSSANSQASSQQQMTLRSQQVRHEYDERLRDRLQDRRRLEERKRRVESIRAELDTITAKLESVKKVHANLENTFGMSHNAAKYFRKTDEDYANLRRKLNQFSEIRSKEVERQLQLKKRLHRFQLHEDREAERRRLRDAAPSLRPRRADNNELKLTSTLNGSLSPGSETTASSSITSTAAAPSNNNSSSTISISSSSSSSSCSPSSCSSPLSAAEELPANRGYNSRHHNHCDAQSSPSIARTTSLSAKTMHKCPVSTSTPSASRPQRRHATTATTTPSGGGNNIMKSTPLTEGRRRRPPIEFSFYKGRPHEDNDTLEITDWKFFEAMEDKSMLQMNELLNKMQLALGDSYSEHCLGQEDSGDISQIRSQVDKLAIQLPDYCSNSYSED